MANLRRLRWIFTERPIYYITACTYNRRRILDRPDVHDSFIRFGLSATEYGDVGRYVIMPDHIHLFAGFGPQSVSVSVLDQVVQKRDFENPETRDFFGTALAERLFRSRHST